MNLPRAVRLVAAGEAARQDDHLRAADGPSSELLGDLTRCASAGASCGLRTISAAPHCVLDRTRRCRSSQFVPGKYRNEQRRGLAILDRRTRGALRSVIRNERLGQCAWRRKRRPWSGIRLSSGSLQCVRSSPSTASGSCRATEIAASSAVMADDAQYRQERMRRPSASTTMPPKLWQVERIGPAHAVIERNADRGCPKPSSRPPAAMPPRGQSRMRATAHRRAGSPEVRRASFQHPCLMVVLRRAVLASTGSVQQTPDGCPAPLRLGEITTAPASTAGATAKETSVGGTSISSNEPLMESLPPMDAEARSPRCALQAAQQSRQQACPSCSGVLVQPLKVFLEGQVGGLESRSPPRTSLDDRLDHRRRRAEDTGCCSV